MTTTYDVLTAAHQTAQAPERMLHTANAGVVVERVLQIRTGYAGAARQALRDLVAHLNTEHAGTATALVYEEAFGTRDRVHVLLHMSSLHDCEALLRSGGPGDFRNGVFGRHVVERYGEVWEQMFVAGGVHDTVYLPHRWGMFGTATEAMAADPTTSPLVPGEQPPRFDVRPAREQTATPPDDLVHSANAGAILHRVAECRYEFRAEARVFARTVAETTNLNTRGFASVYVYEETFGQMDRIHLFVHMRSLGVFYQMMGLDARTDPDAPRASFVRDWVALDQGGGRWDRIVVSGSTRDTLLLPASFASRGRDD